MGEIRLNKPLYKEEGQRGTDGSGAAPLPRSAQGALPARVGAVLVDVLALHAAATTVIYAAPKATAALGLAGPWVGLVAGFIYFAVCGSSLTDGRSLGKLVMRLRLADIAGPALPAGRSALRAALLLWPLPVYLAMAQVADAYDRPTELGPILGLWLPGVALAAGWYAGNLFYAWTSHDKRAWYDLVARSAVVSTDCSADALADYLGLVRADVPSAVRARPRFLLLACLLGFPVLSAYQLMRDSRFITNMQPKDREQVMKYREMLDVPGFRSRPLPPGAPASEGDGGTSLTAEDRNTSTFVIQYAWSGVLTAADVEKQPRAMGSAQRIADYYENEARELVARGDDISTMPKRIRFRTTFAEYSYLFWAWKANDVLSRDAVALLPTDTPTSAPAVAREAPETTATTASAPATTAATEVTSTSK